MEDKKNENKNNEENNQLDKYINSIDTDSSEDEMRSIHEGFSFDQDKSKNGK